VEAKEKEKQNEPPKFDEKICKNLLFRLMEHCIRQGLPEPRLTREYAGGKSFSDIETNTFGFFLIYGNQKDEGLCFEINIAAQLLRVGLSKGFQEGFPKTFCSICSIPVMLWAQEYAHDKEKQIAAMTATWILNWLEFNPMVKWDLDPKDKIKEVL